MARISAHDATRAIRLAHACVLLINIRSHVECWVAPSGSVVAPRACLRILAARTLHCKISPEMGRDSRAVQIGFDARDSALRSAPGTRDLDIRLPGAGFEQREFGFSFIRRAAVFTAIPSQQIFVADCSLIANAFDSFSWISASLYSSSASFTAASAGGSPRDARAQELVQRGWESASELFRRLNSAADRVVDREKFLTFVTRSRP